MDSLWRSSLLSFLVVLVGLGGMGLAQAQSEPPTLVYIMFSGDAKTQAALEGEELYFSQHITRHGPFAFSADISRKQMMNECRERIGLSASAERECVLREARSVMVEVIYEISARRLGSDWELALSVLDDNGNRRSQHVVQAGGRDLAAAARAHFPELALRYLCEAERIAAACSEAGLAPVSGGGGVGSNSGAVVLPGAALDRGEQIVNEIVDRTGFLTVTSEPSRARVEINGQAKGQTPWQDEVMIGSYVVVVDGGTLYHPGRQEIKLTTEGARLNFALKPRFGRLVVSSEPSGAEVFVNGERVGVTPYEHAERLAGAYQVRVSKAEYLDDERVVEVKEGERSASHAILTSNIGTLQVKSSPSGAAVEIDGQSYGTTPQTLRLQPGTYVVKLSLAGHGEQVEKARVSRGERAELNSTLVPRLGLVSVLASTEDGTPCEGVVAVNGKKQKGKTPLKLELTALSHVIQVECPEGVAEETVAVAHNGNHRLALVVKSASASGFVRIKKGSFTMGSPANEPGRDSDESQYEVVLSRDFFMQTTEVTQGQWQALMGNNPSYFLGCGSDCPVERVSWFEALEYANALSRQEGLEACYSLSGCSGRSGGGCSSSENSGYYCSSAYSCSNVTFKGLDCKGYRLPTEAEWEYAARAGSTGRYHDGASSPDAVAWYKENSGSKTHSVAQKKANAWGLYDMHGNVWEWVWDRYDSYPSKKTTDPTGAASGSLRVSRGGGWVRDAAGVRAAHRIRSDPGYRDHNLGFRLCRSSL